MNDYREGTDMTIYIMRHGQTDKNQAKLLQGRSNVALNETGMEEARAAGEWFREKGIAFDHVYASPMIRAMQTAELVTGGQNVTTDERLLEMDYGPYEGMDLTNPAPEIITFFSDFVNNPAPDGMEPLSSVISRMGAFLEDLDETEGNILIATHAVAMKGALEYLTPSSNGSYWAKYISTCGVYAVDRTEDGFGEAKEVYSQGGIKEGV